MTSPSRSRSRSVLVEQALRHPSVNPFTNASLERPSAAQRAKHILMAPIALARLGFIIGSVTIGAVLLKCTLAGVSTESLKKKPLSGVRRIVVRSVSAIVSRLILLGSGYLYISTEGTPAGRAEAPVVIANHTCMMDPFALFYFFGASPVGAVEHLKMPLFGTFVKAAQAITVNRKDPHSRHAVIDAMNGRARSTEDWPQTLIFPEGTTTVRARNPGHVAAVKRSERTLVCVCLVCRMGALSSPSRLVRSSRARQSSLASSAFRGPRWACIQAG